MRVKRYCMDLGARQMRVAVDGKIVCTEPSVLMTATADGRVLVAGKEALAARERSPDNIQVRCPLAQGRAADPTLLEALLRWVRQAVVPTKVSLGSGFLLGRWLPPAVVLTVPAQAADYEREGLQDAARAAGFGKVTLVDEVVAHAAGADWDFGSEPCAVLVVGAAYAQAGVLKDGKVVCARSLHERNPMDAAAGDAFVAQLRHRVRLTYGLHLGCDQAEQVLRDPEQALVAYDERTGRVAEIRLTAEDLEDARKLPLERLAQLLTTTVEEGVALLGAGVSSAIARRGVLLTGGGALLPGLEEALQARTSLGFVRPEDPCETAIRGLMKLEVRA